MEGTVGRKKIHNRKEKNNLSLELSIVTPSGKQTVRG